MGKYKFLLFDMDGTIANTDQMIVATFNELYDRFNPKNKKKEEEILYFSGPPLIEVLPKEFPGYDFEFMRNEFRKTSDKYADSTISLYDDEINVLRCLKNKGYRMVVVTSKDHDRAEHVFDLLSLREFFEFIIGTGDIKTFKPSPEGILLAMEKLGAKKEETLYIGDNDVDYLTSYNAGVDCMLCLWGPRKLTKDKKAKYNVYSYKEIDEILK